MSTCMHAYSLPVACNPQAAIEVLNGWAAEGKLLAIAFFGAGGALFISSSVDRVQVQQNGVVFRGPDNSTFGVVFPRDDSEGYLDYWGFESENAANGEDCGEPAQPLTRDSVLLWLAAKGTPCVEIRNASGYLLVYELLPLVTPVSTIQ